MSIKRPKCSITAFWIASWLLGQACQTPSLYDQKITFDQNQWPATFQPTFAFSVPRTGIHYDVMLVVESWPNYPYQNLHLRCLFHKNHKLVWQENSDRHYALFEAKTGRPLGKRTGRCTTHTFFLIEKQPLQAHVSYTIALAHRMRTASLPGLRSVRLLVRPSRRAKNLSGKGVQATTSLLLPRKLFVLAEQSA